MMDYSAYCSFGILAIAAFDDLRTRRIDNRLMGVFAVVALSLMIALTGIGGLSNALLGLVAGFVFYLPLAWFGIVGGADLKLLSIIGILAGPAAILTIGFFALIWGAFMGIVHVIFEKDLKSFLTNMGSLIRFKKVENKKLHRIPFAVALLLATLTYWSWRQL